MDSKGAGTGSGSGSGVKGRFGPRREPPKVDSTDIRPVPAPSAPPPPRPAPRPMTDSRPESRQESRQESRPDSRPDNRSEPRPDNRPEPRYEGRPDNRDQRDDGGEGDDRGYGNDRYQGRNPYADRDSYRRGAKKRKRGMKSWGDGPGPSMSMRSGLSRAELGLPSDEELEREAQELERAMRDSPTLGKDALSLGDLQRMSVEDVHAVATKEGLTEIDAIPKADLIFKILKARAMKQGIMIGEGTLEMMPDGFGFLRSAEQSYQPGPDDIYIAPGLIRKWGIRRGMSVKGVVRPPKESERYFALLKVDTINGKPPQKAHGLRLFEDLTPHHPEKRFVLESSPDEIECRVVDLVAPLGFGQRALIVAPPRTGKTVLLQKMAKAITRNYPDVKLIVLLVDERPEEVTDFKRNCSGPNIEVVASTFDEHSSRHVQVAEMVIEKAKRMVEFGEHVVIFLDSITRLARAYNNEAPHSGRIMSGGVDAQALQRPKKFFGAARAIDGGGSLTIIGTALVDTGSKMDEVIFEEFKGTGNSELHLDRKLVEKRVWPAIDIAASGTRREELLLDPKELELVYRLRKVLSDMNVVESMDLLKNRLKKVKTNAEFLMTMAMG